MHIQYNIAIRVGVIDYPWVISAIKGRDGVFFDVGVQCEILQRKCFDDFAGVVVYANDGIHHTLPIDPCDQAQAQILPCVRPGGGLLQRKLRSLPNVNVITSALTTEVLGNGEKVTGLRYKDRTTDEQHEVALEGIFVQIGLLPNTDWLKGTVELSPRGEIIVDAKGQTSIPGVFAAGDVTTVPYKQIVIAVGEGAKASLAAFDHLIRTSAPA